MAKKIDISSVFNGLGVPSSTYVAQDNGKHEKILEQSIRERGTLCLITGSSKTGKTTLYNKVLDSIKRTPLVVRCDSETSSEDFWKRPLEAVDFSRLKELSFTENTESNIGSKLGGTIGWQWLAGLIGEVTLGLKKGKSETEIREKILSKPSPQHLIPLLQNSTAILVVEDFHYLQESVQKQIFQQWKVFSDEKVSVLVVGTTHHGVDLAYANPDLIGRIQQIDLKRWSKSDLSKIAKQGFEALELTVARSVIDTIAEESSGLPIITQQTCGQLFNDKGMALYQKGTPVSFQKNHAFKALHNVAVIRYQQFESWYSRLTVGPRKRARKYNTYELVLSVFTLDPLKFELKRHEIDERLRKLPIKFDQLPPSASINSTLSALQKFQKSNGFELLEWSKRDQAIYVLEPAFLFFLRWRKERTSTPSMVDTLFDFIGKLLAT